MLTFNLIEIAPVLKAQFIGHNTTIQGCSIDTRTLETGNLFFALRGEQFDGHAFIAEAQKKGAAAIVVDHFCESPLPQLVVNDTLIAFGYLARWWRQNMSLKHLVAVTGSNGKTTVKEMTRAILNQKGKTLATQANFNNEIGVPLTLLQLTPEHDYAVIEMGARAVGDIARLTPLAQPDVATITQCAPAHLAGFGSVDNVAQAKGEIFHHLPAHGMAVINRDDLYADYWHNSLLEENGLPRCRISSFGLTTTVAIAPEIKAIDWQVQTTGCDFTLITPIGHRHIHLPLLGQHNISNALNAAACALACDCNLDDIQQGLETLTPVKGRLQVVAGLNDNVLLDDTYNANPTSLTAALRVLAQYPAPRWLILGDMKELGEQAIDYHRQAGELARDLGIEQVWTVGDLARHAAMVFGKNAHYFETMNDLMAVLTKYQPEQAHILVKGSRSMQMERVINALKVGY
ncbi:UDP-N-acetylmuramoyl-tripeptide--D-alanyl-D-alanine ligase [Thioflexithrix psekupsensis]|uniref:UDP-N-acetylmuramoyl-tripeptide--D-alanyl-D-alanine ligase n=1 Tax=Thioflexithrix psekupsensis TaxID=1570016 RepID=A0A251X5S6_9GAMM|nr:UDP-N-acetylmuramoyl-tripeptide--D-alanyl-D-alanine ligase [Thioflexithrix psekupsensis]OUD13095.1 hypothetical protein TPSD3_10625 [Thioflexithrix psekupsensis]